MKFEEISTNLCFGGQQKVYSHYSEVCKCDMKFGIFLPSQSVEKATPVIWYLSGLTCTHENAMVKASAQQWASKAGVALIFPDTSPRGSGVPDDDSYALGQGAGFYVDSFQSPWSKNFNMWSYINSELPELVFDKFSLNYEKQGIMGHSMGGLGALNFAIRNPKTFKSVSAFAPIVNPTTSEWGRVQFTHYLGHDESGWEKYDPVLLLSQQDFPGKVLVDQGKADEFLTNLQPEKLKEVLEKKGKKQAFRYQSGYDHSYFFVSTFIKDHIKLHSEAFE
jgi:S-formylglutathione hydrolase